MPNPFDPGAPRRHHLGGPGHVGPPEGSTPPHDSMEEEFYNQFHDLVPVSNTMQGLDPKLLASLPPFLRNPKAQMGKAIDPNPEWIAHVPWMAPKHVVVDQPKSFDRATLAHELTHVFQNTREWAHLPYGEPVYDYGGLKGLNEARMKHKSVSTFSQEQQAEVVADYYRIHLAVLATAKKQGGFLFPAQAEWFEKQKEGYEPFVRQLAGIPEQDPAPAGKWYGAPAEKEAFKEPEPPPVPGLPPSNITGQVELSPTVAGVMAPIPIYKAKKK